MNETLSHLTAVTRAGALRPLDLHFAHWMARLAGANADADPGLMLAAALASRRVGEGDVCVDLAAYAGRPLFDLPEGESEVRAPGLADWRRALRGTAVVGDGESASPLVLDDKDRLYLGRYWRFEQDLAAALHARAGRLVEQIDSDLLREGLARLFPNSGTGTDWQRVAAAQAVLTPLCVISGGPGTGKTRTVTAILALLLEQAGGRAFRIALAAPTGKAAARLSESARRARGDLDLAPQISDALPLEAVTLHRLLGFRPGRAQPRHDRDDPLHLDLLVVDEASMVDLPLMARTLAALPDSARLILLGDKDQLASVEAGKVLGDICGQGRKPGRSERLCDALEAVAAVRLDASKAPPIADHIAVLHHSYRFGSDSGIGAAARAVNGGDGAGAAQLLADPRLPDARLMTLGEAGLAELLRGWLVPRFARCMEPASPAEVLAGLGRFRILCAVREGPFGVRALNRLCEGVLEEAGLITRGGREHYAGRPLMVTSNDYALGLFNGDIGMLLPEQDAGGALRAWFETDGPPRRVLPPRLPPHETVFAMTIHKSQGSEFDEVVLVLPEGESRAVTRELLYTGITRAREQVTLIARPEAVARAAGTPVRRSSGLFDALWESCDDNSRPSE